MCTPCHLTHLPQGWRLNAGWGAEKLNFWEIIWGAGIEDKMFAITRARLITCAGAYRRKGILKYKDKIP
jgi:hypothetical protein